MLLGDLIRGLPISCPPGAEAVRVCDLTEDSRTAVPGSLFVARGGLKADGKRFMADAAAAGAVAILSDQEGFAAPQGFDVSMLHASDIALASALLGERFYGSPASRLGVFGVTGTNGKTTISFLVWKLLNAARHRCGLIGTVMVDDGVECGAASMTTPPAMELSRTMATMVESGCGFASMEVSSHALHQKRADALRFRVAAFTNLTGDHLDYHGTMEAYAAAKARLFEILPADGVAIVNASDPMSARMVRDCAARVVRCAVIGEVGDAAADSTVEVLDESLSGMTLQLRLPSGEVLAHVPLLGRYNAMNVLQAFVSAHALLAMPTPANAPGLSASERRFLGVWTWHDKPGEMTCHYREDGTMSYTFAPNNTSPYIKKWKVDANVISFERVERNLVTSIVKKVLHKHEQYQVTSNADGSITFKSNNGKVKVLIPWSSDSEQEWSFRTIPQIQRPQSGDRW